MGNLGLKKIGIIVGVLFAVVLIVGTVMYISTNNQEVRLRNTIEAKVQDNQSHYTKMWEILTQQAGVAEEYKESFKEIYPELIAGRYNNGQGQLMQWIQEHNPEFDSKLYHQLMVSIEGQRESFHTTQKQLVDYSRQHNNLLETFPSKLFLSGVEAIDIPVVINLEAEKAFSTEREQEMDLFKRK